MEPCQLKFDIIRCITATYLERDTTIFLRVLVIKSCKLHELNQETNDSSLNKGII